MSNKRTIRTKYYSAKLYVRSSASVTLEGALQASVMRMLRDATIDSAYVYASHDDKVQTISVYRLQGKLNVHWHTPGLFPRPDPRKPQTKPAPKPEHIPHPTH